MRQRAALGPIAIHQNTSARAGYRKSLEGWSHPGIKYVELTPGLLDEFLTTDSLAARTSSFISTLTTLLKMTREAAHPNMRPMFDCYHFWSGLNKLEDLDLVRPGEIAHVHFQDVPDMPRELLDNTSKRIRLSWPGKSARKRHLSCARHA